MQLVTRSKQSNIFKQANLHGPIIIWNNSNEVMLHKQLAKWRKNLGIDFFLREEKIQWCMIYRKGSIWTS